MSTDAWDMVPLALVAQVTLGKMVQNSASELETVEQPYLHAANVRDFGILDTDHSHRTMWFSPGEVDSLKVKSGDVVVVEGGAVGKSAYVKNDLPGYGFQNSILRVRAKKRVSDGRFIQYSLQSAYDSGEISRQCSSVSLAHFPAEKINRFRVPYPSLEYQQRIADYLDRETAEIDAAVADLDKYVELLEKRRRVLIAQSVTRGIGSDRTRIHPCSVPGGEGMTENWKQVPFRTLFRRIPKRTGYGDKELLSVYRDYGVIVKSDRDDNSNQPGESLDDYQLVKPGDLVLNKMKTWQGSLGVSAYEGIVSPAYFVYEPQGDFDSWYMHYLLRSQPSIDYYGAHSKGIRVNQWDLQPEYLDKMKVRFPPLEIQQRIADYLDRETTEIDSLIADSTRLRDLLLKRRSVLITEVVTGRKQV